MKGISSSPPILSVALALPEYMAESTGVDGMGN
jgi:hypothetical protein